MSGSGPASYSAARIATRVKALGREISRAYRGRRLDIVVTMDRGFMFAADLVRAIDAPVALHFVREDVRDVESSGKARREVFFGGRATTSASKDHTGFKGHDVLLVDAVIDSGVTQDFLLRRIGENKPRSLRLAVLLDKTSRRRVALEPDYFGFRTASNNLWSGYGLPGANGIGRGASSLTNAGKSNNRKRGKKKR